MKTAIIGTGFIARMHKAAMRSLGRSLDAVVGTTVEKAAAFASDTAAGPYCRVTDELLGAVDCLIICTPPAEHGELLERCLRAGKHVFCEKPLCLSSAEAEKLALLAEKSSGVAVVNFNNRFYPSVLKMRDRVSDVTTVQGSYLQQYHCMPAPFSWRYTDPMRATSEIGSHMIDLVTFVTGQDITSVRGRFSYAAPRRILGADGMLYPAGEGTPITVENEDEAGIDFTLDRGGNGHLELSEIAAGHINDLTLKVETDRGEICWDNRSPHILRCFGSAEDDGEQGDFEDTFAMALEAFYAAAEQGENRDPRLCTFAQAAQNVKVCQAIYDSAHAGGAEVRVTY